MFITKSLTSRSLSPPSILLLIMVVLVLDDSVVLVLDIGDEIVVVTFVVVLVETAVLDRERGVAAKGVTLPVPLARDDLARQRPTPRLDPLYMASWYRPPSYASMGGKVGRAGSAESCTKHAHSVLLLERNWRVSIQMAAKRMSSGHFFCDICEVGFPYRSKYTRHLASDTHQRFSDLLSLDSIEHMESPSTDISSLPFSDNGVQDSFSTEVSIKQTS